MAGRCEGVGEVGGPDWSCNGSGPDQVGTESAPEQITAQPQLPLIVDARPRKPCSQEPCSEEPRNWANEHPLRVSKYVATFSMNLKRLQGDFFDLRNSMFLTERAHTLLFRPMPYIYIYIYIYIYLYI